MRRCREVASRRTGDDQVLLDGDHLLRDALDAGVTIDAVVTDGRAPSAIVHAAAAAGAAIYHATAPVMSAISPVTTPSGVVAIGRWRPAPLADLFAAAGLVIGLVDVQDPGNVGAVVRAADAFGSAGVAALGQSADPAGWKALRGAMGSAFRVVVARGEVDEAFAAARRGGVAIAATVAAGGSPIDTVDLARPLLVLLGHEGAGLDAATTARADERWTIPMSAGVNSLNVAVAAGLIAYLARPPQEHAP